MLEVLEPLEIADSDTSSIQEDIRKEADTLSSADPFPFQGGGAIGSLDYDFALETMGIVLVDGHLEGSRDEEITE